MADQNEVLRNISYITLEGDDKPSEVFDTISEEISLENGTASVTLRIPWENRHDIIELIYNGAGGVPAIYPHKLTKYGSELYANGLTIKPFPTKYDSEGQAIGYKYALITISYAPWETEITTTSTTEFLKVNPAGLYWKTKRNGVEEYINLAQDQAPAIPMRSFEMSVSRTNMIPFDIFAWEGTCNSKPITIDKKYLGQAFTFPAETLALQSPEIRTPAFQITPDGHCTISCKLLYNPLTHNMWYDPLQDCSEQNPNPDRIEYHKVAIYKQTSGTGAGGSGESSNYERVVPLTPKDYDQLFQYFKIAQG